jgi:hypothetical protein
MVVVDVVTFTDVVYMRPELQPAPNELTVNEYTVIPKATGVPSVVGVFVAVKPTPDQ